VGDRVFLKVSPMRGVCSLEEGEAMPQICWTIQNHSESGEVGL
jgi:hypothetical protein